MPEMMIISKKIEEVITEIEKVRASIKPRGQALAEAQVDYDCALAKKIIELKEDNQITIVEKLARGEIAKERLQLEVSTSSYKSCTTNLQALIAVLNAYMNLNRHQTEV